MKPEDMREMRLATWEYIENHKAYLLNGGKYENLTTADMTKLRTLANNFNDIVFQKRKKDHKGHS